MDVGVDIIMKLSRECFIGTVCVGLSEGSAVQAVEVFKADSKNLGSDTNNTNNTNNT
jgi:hypothetical protein